MSATKKCACVLLLVVFCATVLILRPKPSEQPEKQTGEQIEILLNQPKTSEEEEIWWHNVQMVKEVEGYFIGGRPKAVADFCFYYGRLDKMNDTWIASAERYREGYCTYLHITMEDGKDYYFDVDTGGFIWSVTQGDERELLRGVEQ